MKILNRKLAWDRLMGEWKRARHHLLFLDYDGTLAPFHVERNKARPYPGVKKAIEEIMASPGHRVVIISGRDVSDLAPLLGVEPLPELWGAHGRQRLLQDGTSVITPLSPDQEEGMETARSLLKDMGLWELVEPKPGCLAVHTRGLSSIETKAVEEKVTHQVFPRLRASGLDLHRFDGGLEIRAPGCHKGEAVKTVLSELDSSWTSAYLGDDLTDEDAFKAIKGRGLAVLVRPEPRATSADLWIRPPEELLWFLRLWREGGEDERTGNQARGSIQPPSHHTEQEG